jgi:hypothetical protein
MRRNIALILAGLGVFLIVLAVALPTYLAPRVLKFPLNEFESVTETASNATYFSAAKVAEVTGANLEATYTLKGNAAAGNSATAVWNEYVYLKDLTNNYVVTQQTRTFAFDRKTGYLVACCGESMNGTPIKQSGLSDYLFPINTAKQNYQVWDIYEDKPVPAVYQGTSSVNGIQTYQFLVDQSSVRLGTTVTVPGSLIGVTVPSVTVPEYYSTYLQYEVDPETGAVLRGNDHLTLFLRSPITGAQEATLLDANLVASQATINEIVAIDNSGRLKVTLLNTVLPIVGSVVGALALVAALLLHRKPREDVEAGNSATAPELAPVPAPDLAAAARTSPIPGLDGEGESGAMAEAPVATSAAAEEAGQPDGPEPPLGAPAPPQPQPRTGGRHRGGTAPGPDAGR